jgi:hypothetical protein
MAQRMQWVECARTTQSSGHLAAGCVRRIHGGLPVLCFLFIEQFIERDIGVQLMHTLCPQHGQPTAPTPDHPRSPTAITTIYFGYGIRTLLAAEPKVGRCFSHTMYVVALAG